MMNVMAIVLSGVIGSANAGLEWTNDYGVALSSARCEGRPMLVVLENREKVAERAGSIFHVEPKVLTKFEICRVDVGSEYGRKIAKLYTPSELPYTVITDAECEQVVFRGVGERTIGEWTDTLEDHTEDEQQAEGSGSSKKGHSGSEVATPSTSMSTPFGHQRLDDAKKAAKANQRMALVFVSMDNCKFCDKMLDETFSDADVSHLLAEQYESVIVKQTDNPELVTDHGIKIFPATLVFSPSGNLLTKIDGFVTPTDFTARLKSHQPGESNVSNE